MAKIKEGRPTVMTQDVIGKLEQVFALGGTDLEACFYAGISKDAFYDYQAKYPDFADRKEMLKEKPILKARQTIIENLNTLQGATWYLERKKKLEFSIRTEYTGKDGGAIEFKPITGMNIIKDNDN